MNTTPIDFVDEHDEPLGIGRVYWSAVPSNGDRVCLGVVGNYIVVERQYSISSRGDGSPLYNDLVVIITVKHE